jgi:hypothetical protein
LHEAFYWMAVERGHTTSEPVRTLMREILLKVPNELNLEEALRAVGGYRRPNLVGRHVVNFGNDKWGFDITKFTKVSSTVRRIHLEFFALSNAKEYDLKPGWEFMRSADFDCSLQEGWLCKTTQSRSCSPVIEFGDGSLVSFALSWIRENNNKTCETIDVTHFRSVL